jgi:MFS transporter, DHA1 family, multidrug resistance protein
MLKIGHKLLLLILSDVLIWSSFGLIAPIFAIFIKDNLIGGSLITAGLATTILLATKSIIQIPLSLYIDKQKHKTNFLIFGTFLIISIPFIYVLADHIYTIFLAQFIWGIGAAFAHPVWFTLFTQYMDKKHKGFEYSLWSTGMGIGTAITAFLGAGIADLFGFKLLFFVVGFFAFLGFLLLLFLDKIHNK